MVRGSFLIERTIEAFAKIFFLHILKPTKSGELLEADSQDAGGKKIFDWMPKNVFFSLSPYGCG